MTAKVIILAAGVGSRLAPISTAMPKSLTKVAGREIIEHQIAGYLAAGVQEKDITVVVGYMADVMTDYFEKNHPRINVIGNAEYAVTNNMYSLYMALNSLEDSVPDVLFINNADCVYDAEIISGLLASQYENAIGSEIGAHNDESMKISVDGSGKLINIAKTIGEADAHGLSIDLYKFSADAVKKLHDIVKDYIEVQKDRNQWTEVSFPELFKRVEVYPYDIKGGRWFEIDNLEDLSRADKLFADFDITGKDALILDLDGTVYLGSNPITPAVDWINSNAGNYDFYYLTNNTSRTPADYVKKLSAVGIHADEESIVTPLYALSDYIRAQGLKSAYLLANKSVEVYLKAQHPDVAFDYDFENNQAVILTYDDEINYEKFKNACVLLNNKPVEYLATHNDKFCPSPEGGLPDAGAYIALIAAVTNKEPSLIFGKPDVRLVASLVMKYGADKLAVAGDRLYTDKLLADNAGIDFICVLTGETSRYDVALADFEKYPAVVLWDLGEL